MKPRQLPQPVLSRWLELDDRCAQLQQDALDAEGEVARLRSVLKSGTNDVTAEEFNAAKNSFQDVYTDAQRKRAKAGVQMRLLASTKTWIGDLPSNTKLVIQHAPINGVDLTQVRHELKELRDELRKLQGYPPASPDIEAKVREYVIALARSARPMVRGYHSGGTLDVRWPTHPTASRQNGAGFAPENANPLLMMAALDPAGIVEMIHNTITDEQPLSQEEHAERVEKLTDRITELSYTEAALIERNGGEHSVEALPMAILGVRIAVEEEVAA